MNLAIEAMAGFSGVRARDVRDIKEAYDVFRVKDSVRYDLNGVISHLVSKLNTLYDFLGVVFLGILKLLSKIGLPLKNKANNWQKDRDYFCSELCYEAFHKGGGLDIVPDVSDADITSPGDIAKGGVLGVVG